MSKEEDKVLDHEYDGIQELDNNLPLWWLWTFFGAIIFSFIYWLHYSFIEDGPSLDQELEQSMAAIELSRKTSQGQGEKGDKAVDPEVLLAQGKKIFKVNCASCHLENGGGSIGPNLTDAYWLHGEGDDESVTKVILKGVLDKGMPPWEAILRPQDIQSLVVYIASLKGSNVSGGKAPQGKKVSE